MSEMMDDLPISQDSEYEDEQNQEEDDESTVTESSVEEEDDEDEHDCRDKAIYRFAELVGDIPQNDINGIMETIEGILTGNIELMDYVENNKEPQMFGLIMTMIVIIMIVIIAILIETKMDSFTLEKFK